MKNRLLIVVGISITVISAIVLLLFLIPYYTVISEYPPLSEESKLYLSSKCSEIALLHLQEYSNIFTAEASQLILFEWPSLPKFLDEESLDQCKYEILSKRGFAVAETGTSQMDDTEEHILPYDEDSQSLNKKWGELYIEAQILKESLYTDSTNMTTIERMFEIDNETMRIATILSERGFTIDVPDYKHTQRIQLSELRVSPIISDVTPEMWNENQKKAEERNVIRLEQLEKLNNDADFVKATKIIQGLNSTNIEDDDYWQTVLDSLILITEKQGISLNGTLSFEDSEMLRELIRQEK